MVVVVMSAGSTPAAWAEPGNITLASTSASGVKGNAMSSVPSLSADGNKVAFHSQATNLLDSQTTIPPGIYVKNLVTEEIILASTSDTGVPAHGIDQAPSLSADGTKVAFAMANVGLDPADTDTVRDIYVKDLITGEITLASTSATGVKGNHGSRKPVLSADGTKVTFESFADNLNPRDPDTFADVYVKNLRNGNLRLASTSDGGVKGNSDSFSPSLSADGTKVAFVSEADNLEPASARSTLYVKNLATGDITLADTSDSGTPGNVGSDKPSLSADGTRVAFNSGSTNLDPGDTESTFSDIYVKDLVTNDIVLASTTVDGVKGSRGGSRPMLSGNGLRVAFFSNSENLACTPCLKDLVTGALIRGAPSSDTGESANQSVYGDFPLSFDGTKVAFFTDATNLDPADTDTIPDIYVKAIATVTVAPASGRPGKQVTITGAGFQPGETVQAKYRTSLSPPPTGPSTTVCTGVVAADGAFGCQGAIPTGTSAGEPGVHDIVAKGLTSLINVRTTFKLHATVSIGDNFYEPPTVNVVVGTKVVWTNNGFSAHTVTSDTGAFDSSPLCPSSGCVEPGGTFSFRFTTPGSYAYRCTLHPGQRGTVTVT